MLLPALSPGELSKRIVDIQLELHQPTYTGRPNENITTFLDSIEHNSRRLNIPPVQWVDVALYFMVEIVRKVMQKYKENILRSKKTNDNLWEVFKSVLKGLHDNAVQQSILSLTDTFDAIGDGRQDPNCDLFLEAAAKGVAVAGVTYAVGPVVVLAALNTVGFTSSGVLAGSAAASVQSLIYGGSTGGLFSVMQSIGATGVVASVPVLGLAAGVVGLAAAGAYFIRNRSRRSPSSSLEEVDEDPEHEIYLDDGGLLDHGKAAQGRRDSF
ncbi:hypothetical protein BDP27DRAFT_1448995 [Rhodocollybia butyracea]|uniref:Uncharacterized protein n=1 Tax=Rhodocollybia butyracea TaxID=206335 RepID=A0A9P5PQK4_9AGAR|nr:hypothetical protein BDP27DRAFT_1448995 [Rhodocollybia butyracea]